MSTQEQRKLAQQVSAGNVRHVAAYDATFRAVAFTSDDIGPPERGYRVPSHGRHVVARCASPRRPNTPTPMLRIRTLGASEITVSGTCLGVERPMSFALLLLVAVNGSAGLARREL